MPRSRHSARPQSSVPIRGPVTQGDTLFQRANEAFRTGNCAAAAALYRQCAALQPTRGLVFFNLGCALQAQEDHWGAASAFRQSIALKPTAEAHVNLAEALRRQNLFDEAMTHCSAALALDHRRVEAYVIRSALLWRTHRRDEALADLRAAIHLKPNHADAHVRLAGHLASTSKDAESIVHYEKARALRPDHAETHRLLAIRYKAVGRMWDAFTSLQKAVELDPQNAAGYNELAALLCHTDMLDLAVSTAKLALALSPHLAAAAFNLGTALTLLGRDGEAIDAYRKAVELDPQDGESLFQLCKLHERACDWEGLESAQTLARTMTYRSGRRAAPFSVLSLTPSPAEHLLSARTYAARCVKLVGAPLSQYLPRNAEMQSNRIRVGYLSADFHTHATADLIAEVFELHDRERFELFGYSLGLSDESPMRRRLAESLGTFRDIRGLSHTDAANRIFADRIDILVDLKGYTHGCKTEIMALRPAPIQVNYLGYPGTMGAPFIDYIIADEAVVPFEHAPFYDEKIVHLPHSYQPNDRKRARPVERPSRTAHGLPEDGFVFCCFNNSYKISREVFAVWMDLLARVPGSVLWLLANDGRAFENLRREAQSRGIDPARLVFARRLPRAEHLARVALGDLFLDTLLYNAHTTASEALWVGVPVVTCQGAAFPARVGASLLRAVGLPDLVTHDLAAYAAKALELASDAGALAAVTTRLLETRDQSPLFDTPRYTRHLETAYRRMVDLRDEGHAPEAFAVDAL